MCNTVYYVVFLMMNDQIRSKHVEQTKHCGIKIDYKNCESRCLLTRCSIMHGTHNVKLFKNISSLRNMRQLKLYSATYDAAYYLLFKLTLPSSSLVLQTSVSLLLITSYLSIFIRCFTSLKYINNGGLQTTYLWFINFRFCLLMI